MLKPTLQLKLGQTLTMTPQLQQAIRLLQLPVLDLNAQIQEALEENIMLEMEDLPDVPTTSADTTAEVETIKADELWQTRSAERIQDGGWNGEGRPISEFADESGQSLRDHLLWQIEMEHFSPREVVIGEAIVDSINDDGYLEAGLGDILASLDEAPPATEKEIERTLTKIQHLDPIGVGARSLSECIVLQLSQLDWKTPALQLAIEIATDHLDLVATRDYGELRRGLRTTEDDLHDALALIRGCNPRPGTAVSPAAAEYVIHRRAATLCQPAVRKSPAR
jgi:RNA polymerase sigma-54 factor